MNVVRLSLLFRQLGAICFEIAEAYGTPANETTPPKGPAERKAPRRGPRPLSPEKLDGLSVSDTDRAAGRVAARSRNLQRGGSSG